MATTGATAATGAGTATGAAATGPTTASTTTTTNPTATPGGAVSNDLDRVLADMHIDGRTAEAAKELLEYTAQAAEGYTPQMAVEIVELMRAAPRFPFDLVIACIASVGQIKQNMERNELMRELEITLGLTTSDASRRSVVNFSAVKLVGQLWVWWLKDDIPALKKLNDKHGNVWNDDLTSFPDNAGGQINKRNRTEMTFPPTPAKPTFGPELALLKRYYQNATGRIRSDLKDEIRDNLRKKYSAT